jgi:hypothetical protein
MLLAPTQVESRSQKTCRLPGSAYTLVEDPTLQLVFSPDRDVKMGAAFKFSIRQRGNTVLDATVQASQGFPINEVRSDVFSGDLGFGVIMSLLDEHLKDLGEPDPDTAPSYVIIPVLSQALYYSDPNHEPPPFKGSVWKRSRCGS